jgi:hypothetical protein
MSNNKNDNQSGGFLAGLADAARIKGGLPPRTNSPATAWMQSMEAAKKQQESIWGKPKPKKGLFS